jgi:hypothetical protein
VVGRINKVKAAPEGSSMVLDYEATREAAMAAFAKSWRWE